MPHEVASANERDSRSLVPRVFVGRHRAALIAFVLGAVSVAGFAPLYLFPLPLLTLTLLMWLWRASDSPKRAAILGWWFGLGYFLTGVSWVYVSLHTFGAMPAPLAAFFTLVFCAFLALFPAVTGYCVAAVRAPLWIKLIVIAPAAWTLTEWTRGWIFTGFPWLALGYSQVPSSPLAGFAPVLGVYGVTWVTVLSAGLLVLLANAVVRRRQSNRPLKAGWMLALLAVWLAGFALKQMQWTTPKGEPLSVTLLQGNIPQDIKWTAEGLRTTLGRYRDLALSSRAKLIVFPETALPLFLRDVPLEYLAELAQHARENDGDVLIGVPEVLPSGEYYNSVVSLGTSPAQSYRKSHLVPFGEFIPLRPVLGWIVSVLAIPLQDFSRGALDAKPLAIAGQRVAVNICYEDAFGEEIIRPLPEATLLVNVSNVAWFGRSIAPYQHLQISQARALETGRYMLRATNTGMTGVVDAHGNIVEVAPQFSTAAVRATVQGYSGATPYVRWGNMAILALCVVMLVSAVVYARVHTRTP
ncbi:MAG: apolipoprotein N-acyltransferase [Burkholderiales bacterium]